MKAIWNGKIIAESGDTIVVEGNQYFPPSSVKMEYLSKSDTPYTCPWKGVCQYYNLKVEGKENKDAAFAYLDPSEAAKNIKGYVAFWKDVEVG